MVSTTATFLGGGDEQGSGQGEGEGSRRWYKMWPCVLFVGIKDNVLLCGGGDVECDGGSGRVLLGDRSREASLAEELVDFLIPSFGCGGDYFHPVDSV